MVTHDSFAVSEGIIESFEESTGITVNLLTGEDTGSMLSQVILTKDNPIADVVYGIDNTFLQRALDEDLFIPYRSPAVESVPPELQLDAADRVTPIDYGDVCVNYWIDATDGPPPETLEDLVDPRHAGSFVTQNPETSSPGLAFLLATWRPSVSTVGRTTGRACVTGESRSQPAGARRTSGSSWPVAATGPW